MKSLLKKKASYVAKTIGIDEALLLVLLSRAWSITSGIITLSLITQKLSIEEQGTFYAFANILGLQIFLELGFSTVIMHTASHEMANVTFTDKSTLSGPEDSLQRISSLLKSSIKAYLYISCAFCITIIPAGTIFFKSTAPSTVNWQIPWIVLCISAASAMLVTPLLSFIEGCGKIIEVNKCRLTYGIASNIGSWIVLLAGGKLLCTAAVYTSITLVGGTWIIARHKQWLIKLIKTPRTSSAIDWKKEIWPFQWKIAISWLSGYFILQTFIPVTYYFDGATSAGKLGLTLQILNLISGLAISWITTKSATFGVLIAKKSWKELDSKFFTALKQGAALLTTGITALVLCAALAEANQIQIAHRILPLPQLIAASLAVSAFYITGSLATLLRCHKDEPFMWHSLGSGACLAIFTAIAAQTYGVNGVCIAWLGAQAFISLPWAIAIFKKYNLKARL